MNFQSDLEDVFMKAKKRACSQSPWLPQLNINSGITPLLFFSSSPLVVNCTDPGIPANSIRESKIEHGNFTFGSVVFYDCNPGYYLFGSSVLTCQPEGHWDKPLPECIGTASFLVSFMT